MDKKVKVLTTENLADNVAKVVKDDNCNLTYISEIMRGYYKYLVLKSSKGILIRVLASDCKIKTSNNPKKKTK
tara:strand:+ start:87 stop:305 length:219 start_codon:yes stop_codon:yes gene_type:complete